MNSSKSKKECGSEFQETVATTYYIYIIRCENNILYTGITTDYLRRFNEHSDQDGTHKGAKFTRSHRPEKIVALWKTKTRSYASKLEARIKQLDKSEKEMLINDNSHFKKFFKNLIDARKFRRLEI